MTAGHSGEIGAIGAVALRRRAYQRLDVNGKLSGDAMAEATRQRNQLMEIQGVDPASPTWTFMGPNNVGGRTRAIIVHPTNPNTMWLGSVGGGIWKTTDAGASWFGQNDYLPSLCIGCMVIDKNNPNTLYAGSGESYFNTSFGENNKAAIQGAGIYKTTDGGTTWTQIPSTQTPDFNVVSRLSMSPTDSLTLLASTDTGIFRTTDGGATWTKVYGNKTYDVDFHPTDANRVVAGLPVSPWVVVSSDGGLTWTNSTGLTTNVRAETTWSKSVTGNVYAAISNANSIKIWKSTNFGASWTLKTSGNSPSCYEAYNNALWVDPTNDNNVLVAGVYIFRSTNQGTTLSQVFTSVHPDFHAIVESSAFNGNTNKVVFFGHDGGISRVPNFSTSGSTDLNNSLGITQFYGGAVNDTSGRIVAGAQDNYTQVYTGTLNWTGVIGGDGVHCASDPQFPSAFYAGYYYLNMFRDDGGLNFGTDITGGISDRGLEANCNFVPYLMLDPNQSNTMLACARRLWRSKNVRTGNPPTWTVIKPPIADSNNPPIEGVKEAHFAPERPYNLSYCAVAKSDSNVIWASHNNGQIYKSTDGLANSPTWMRVDQNGPLPARWPSCIIIDNANSDHVYVSYMGFAGDNIWETTDGGATFQQVTGSGPRKLPTAPVSAIALDPMRPGHLIAGTDIGIFTTWDNGATWSVTTQGPGTVPIDFFSWRNNSQLMAYTYGRGVWQGNVNPVDVGSTPVSFSIFRGVLVSGGLFDVLASDDQKLVVRNGFVANQSESPVTIEFTGTSPNGIANSITVTCEASVSTPGLLRTLQAFNYDTQAWVQIDSRAATLSDQVVTATITNNVSSFIAPSTNQMKLRFLVRPAGPVAMSLWTGNVDLVEWTVSQ